MQINTKIVSCHTADSKPVKQEVKSTVILPPLVFPGQTIMGLIGTCRIMTLLLRFGFLQIPYLLNVFMLSVVIPCVLMLNVIMLCVTLLSVVWPIVIIIYVVMQWVLLLSVILPRVIFLSVLRYIVRHNAVALCCVS